MTSTSVPLALRSRRLRVCVFDTVFGGRVIARVDFERASVRAWRVPGGSYVTRDLATATRNFRLAIAGEGVWGWVR